MKHDAILFDFDGVLADTEPIHYSCWKDLLAPFGIALEWDYYQQHCVGVADRLMVERLAATHNPPVPLDFVWPQYERKQGLFRARLEAATPFLPETTDLIENLSIAYKLAVVSSSARLEVEPPLVRAGIRPYFELLVCGKEALHEACAGSLSAGRRAPGRY